MSLTPAFAPDARSQWQELEPVLQELVLDEMDALASDPPITQASIIRRDIAHHQDKASHYLFLRFTIDERRLTLIGIHHHIQPAQPEI
jgi:hypothetical protein